MTRARLPRRLLAELLGTAGLVAVVVGSGIAASRLSPDDVGLQLLENAVATGVGLFVLILVVGPVSGAHLNPVVSLADALLGRRSGGLPLREVPAYSVAQCIGGIGGAALANALYDLPVLSRATTERTGSHLWLSEAVATAGLLLVVFALARSGLATRSVALVPAAVGAYITGAYFVTSSTSFANPAVTLGRAFSDTFAGIAPVSVPGFVLAQLAGLVVGLGLVLALYPSGAPHAEGDVLVPPVDRSSP